MTLKTICGVSLIASVAAGCNAPAPTSPLLAFTPGPAPTIYAGTAVDSVDGNGTVTVSLNSAAGLTSGLWNMSFAGKADPQYFVSGTLNGNQYTAIITGCQDTGVYSGCTTNCSFTFAGTFASSGLTGAYTADAIPSCPVRTGTIKTTAQ